jgi:hypothetical protein
MQGFFWQNLPTLGLKVKRNQNSSGDKEPVLYSGCDPSRKGYGSGSGFNDFFVNPDPDLYSESASVSRGNKVRKKVLFCHFLIFILKSTKKYYYFLLLIYILTD